jgi:tetratricopeptide (TPR) repeat protein
MKCDEVEAADLPARYLAGDLGDAEREAYEEHYFGCDACFGELEILRTTQAVLADEAPSGRGRKRVSVLRWLPIAAALAAGTTLAVWWSAPRSELTQLARFEPPRYDPPRVRSGSDPNGATFDRAMSRYRAGDFAGAIPEIEEHLRRNRDDVRAAFFLGVSLLATGQSDPAIRQFQSVVATRDPAYEEVAFYLMAKAHIKRGDVPAALAALDRTIALDGAHAAEARALRERLLALGHVPLPTSTIP